MNPAASGHRGEGWSPRAAYTRGVRGAMAFLGRTIGAIKLLACDDRIPKPLRWIAALGLLPFPGPLDEAVLVLIAPIFLAFYREPMREAWSRAAG